MGRVGVELNFNANALGAGNVTYIGDPKKSQVNAKNAGIRRGVDLRGRNHRDPSGLTKVCSEFAENLDVMVYSVTFE